MVRQVEHIGKSIRMLRILAGLNQAELARQIGKTRGMISQIENSGKVNHYTLQDIAKALSLSVEFIENYHLDPTSTPYHVNEPDEPYKHKDIKALEQEIKLLKEMVEYQRKIIALLENRLGA